MSKTLLFDMSAGVSGDMVLGGLFSLGLDPAVVNAPLRELGLPATVEFEPVSMQGLQAGRALVRCEETAPSPRGLGDFLALLERVSTPAPAREDAARILRRLAEAEAEVHGISIEKVHFHEIGGLDTLVDVLGAALGLQALGIDRCLTTPFPFGRGLVAMEHGAFPEPVPATMALTRGFPSFRTDWEGEHCTPTGAAIVTALARPVTSDWTATLLSVGYGAGSRTHRDRANVLRLCLYEESEATDAVYGVFQIECNLDNATPEQVAFAAEKLLAAGCLDAWQETLVMKKGRAGVKLCALADGRVRDEALRIIVSETPAGGLRWFPVRRVVGRKHPTRMETSAGVVDAKAVDFPAFGVQRVGAEYASVRELAKRSGLPLRHLQQAEPRAEETGNRG